MKKKSEKIQDLCNFVHSLDNHLPAFFYLVDYILPFQFFCGTLNFAWAKYFEMLKNVLPIIFPTCVDSKDDVKLNNGMLRRVFAL